MITAEECEVDENGRLIDPFGDDVSDDVWLRREQLKREKEHEDEAVS